MSNGSPSSGGARCRSMRVRQCAARTRCTPRRAAPAGTVGHVDERRGARAALRERDGGQQREEEHAGHLAARECARRCASARAHREIDRAASPRMVRMRGDGRAVDVSGFDVHPGARLHRVDDEANCERERRRVLEIDDGLHADAPGRVNLVHPRDADDERREHGRREPHPDQADGAPSGVNGSPRPGRRARRARPRRARARPTWATRRASSPTSGGWRTRCARAARCRAGCCA